jgi:hypothetical protein
MPGSSRRESALISAENERTHVRCYTVHGEKARPSNVLPTSRRQSEVSFAGSTLRFMGGALEFHRTRFANVASQRKVNRIAKAASID